MKAKQTKTLIVKLPHEYAENIVTGRAEVALLHSCPPPSPSSNPPHPP